MIFFKNRERDKLIKQVELTICKLIWNHKSFINSDDPYNILIYSLFNNHILNIRIGGRDMYNIVGTLYNFYDAITTDDNLAFRIYRKRIIVLSRNIKGYTKVLKFKEYILKQFQPEEITMKLQSALLRIL